MLSTLLVACSREPTPFEVPPNAQSVKHLPILNGRAFQTQFTLQAAYPATPALEFYRAHISKPWVLCQWAPEWSHFIDAQTDVHFAVYQQLHMWVNSEEQRTVMLSMRYHAPEGTGDTPDNDTQHILLVEYMGTSVADTIKELKLRCPANEVAAR